MRRIIVWFVWITHIENVECDSRKRFVSYDCRRNALTTHIYPIPPRPVLFYGARRCIAFRRRSTIDFITTPTARCRSRRVTVDRTNGLLTNCRRLVRSTSATLTRVAGLFPRSCLYFLRPCLVLHWRRWPQRQSTMCGVFRYRGGGRAGDSRPVVDCTPPMTRREWNNIWIDIDRDTLPVVVRHRTRHFRSPHIESILDWRSHNVEGCHVDIIILSTFTLHGEVNRGFDYFLVQFNFCKVSSELYFLLKSVFEKYRCTLCTCSLTTVHWKQKQGKMLWKQNSMEFLLNIS